MTESTLHMNCLEFLAVQNVLQTFLPVLVNRTVLVISDNVTTVFYINQQGGTRFRRLCKLAIALWNWCLPHGITLQTVHIPWVENTSADVLSRSWVSHGDWSLNLDLLQPIFCRFGCLTMNAFANSQNAKRAIFFSRNQPSPTCLGGAFLHHWFGTLFCTFPPIPLID